MRKKQTSPEETLTEIRQLMERSSRFISLSGLSGVLAGVYALAGIAAAYYILHAGLYIDTLIVYLATIALSVLVLAVGTGIWLTTQRARKDGNSLFDSAALRLIINLIIPLGAGAVFCSALIFHRDWPYLAPVMLIFYGLSLINASKYTRDDVRSLGVAEIVVGGVALFVDRGDLIFLAIGFGVLHIIYGTRMYLKYER